MSEQRSKVSSPLLTQKKRMTWTQTERSVHEAWGQLGVEKPRASALMHFLVAHMDAQNNAVVASWRTLAQLTGMSVATVRRAMADLETRNWVEGIQLGGGGAKAWLVNSRVAWARSRSDLRFASFNARVLASGSEQREPLDNRPPLRRIPVISPGEKQLPHGPGEPPPSQQQIAGMEPDLPSLHPGEDQQDREELERLGQQRIDYEEAYNS